MKLGVYRGVCLKAYEVVAPIAEELGYDIWDVEYYKEGSEQILCITIDKEDGVDILDCEKMSRAVDEPLDVADPVPVEYFLEVSSPGIERELKRAEHFEAFIGERVRVGFYASPKEGIFKGHKNAEATLEDFSEEDASVTLSVGEECETVSLEKITGIKIAFEF